MESTVKNVSFLRGGGGCDEVWSGPNRYLIPARYPALGYWYLRQMDPPTPSQPWCIWTKHRGWGGIEPRGGGSFALCSNNPDISDIRPQLAQFWKSWGMGNPKYWVYPTFRVNPNIGYTQITWRTRIYPIKYFNTFTWPVPVCYPTFFSIPDPTMDKVMGNSFFSLIEIMVFFMVVA